MNTNFHEFEVLQASQKNLICSISLQVPPYPEISSTFSGRYGKHARHFLFSPINHSLTFGTMIARAHISTSTCYSMQETLKSIQFDMCIINQLQNKTKYTLMTKFCSFGVFLSRRGRTCQLLSLSLSNDKVTRLSNVKNNLQPK